MSQPPAGQAGTIFGRWHNVECVPKVGSGRMIVTVLGVDKFDIITQSCGCLLPGSSIASFGQNLGVLKP